MYIDCGMEIDWYGEGGGGEWWREHQKVFMAVNRPEYCLLLQI